LLSEIECSATNLHNLLSISFAPHAYTAPVERAVAVGNIVKEEDQTTLDHEPVVDDECYTGKDGAPDGDCVDFDP
jgi:hypothetical protein